MGEQQEVMPVNSKAKDSFFKKVYEDETRQRELVSFLLGVDIGKVSVSNIRPVIFGNRENDFAGLCDDVFYVLTECQASVSPNISYRLVEYAIGGLRSMIEDDTQSVYGSTHMQFPIPKFYVLQVGLEPKDKRLSKEVQYDLHLSDLYVSAEKKFGKDTPKPDLDAAVHVYDFRMTFDEVLSYIEDNTLPERFDVYKTNMLNYALVANGVTYMQRVKNGTIKLAPKNVSNVVKYLQLLLDRDIFVDLLSDKEVCNMTVLQFSREEELKEAGREEERKNTEAERVSGIQSTARTCLRFKQSYQDAVSIVMEEYPDTDKAAIELIVAEVYGIQSAEVK